ncbi:MAG: DUF3108 domain-containing protein [Burkholderiaceae bacterium]
MTAALAPAALPPLQRQLAAATVLVVAVHALLLLGLPRLRHATENSIDAGAFITRRIAPPAPAAPAAPAPAAAPEAAPAPRPEPVVTPAKPKPVARTHQPPAKPAATARNTAPVTPQPPGPAGATAPSLLNARPTGQGDFGGGALPQPIAPPLTAEATGPALALAQTLGDDVAVRIPRAAELGFQAKGNIGGQAFAVPVNLQWRQDGRWYESRFGFYNPKAGARKRHVVGLITPQGLLPVRLQMQLPDVQDVRFDYDRAQVAFSASGTEAPLVAGMQDRLSVLFQLGALLGGDPERYPVGTAISLPAAFERGEGTWRFAVEADEDIPALRDKTVPTVHLIHVPFDDRSARIEVWLGRTLDYLPVRLRTTEPNGDTVEYTLVTAWAQPTPIAPSQAPAPSGSGTP